VRASVPEGRPSAPTSVGQLVKASRLVCVGNISKGTKPMEGQGASALATMLKHYGLVYGAKPRR